MQIKLISIFFLSLLFCVSCNEASSVSPKSSIERLDDSTQSILIGKVNFLMKYVQAGTFDMGEDKGGKNERPVHKVTLTKDYWIGETEVTQELWKEVMLTNPSCFQNKANRPVERVSFYDAIIFCNKLSLLLGKEPVYSKADETNPNKWGEIPNSLDSEAEWDKNITIHYNHNGFRLPTEAEWEYAARGGKNSKNYKYSGTNDPYQVVFCYFIKSDTSTQRIYPAPVKSKIANELGLYDMSGNVMEWCNNYYSNYDSDSEIDPKDDTNINKFRILRGGAWISNAEYCRIPVRNYYISYFRYYHCGFRIVLNN